MKNIMKLVFLMVAVLGMTSCDLFNVNIDSSVEGTLDVYVDEPMAKSANEWSDFEATKEISPSDAEDYKDNIVGVEVNEVIVTVDYVSSEGVILGDGTSFYMTDGVTTVSWSIVGDWPIFNDEQVHLADGQGNYAEVGAMIQSAIDNDTNLTIGTNGTSSMSGVSFTLTLYTGITVEGSLF